MEGREGRGPWGAGGGWGCLWIHVGHGCLLGLGGTGSDYTTGRGMVGASRIDVAGHTCLRRVRLRFVTRRASL